MDFEKLGAFYLGKAYDLEENKRRDELVLYDSKDLTTHAVIVGMTGSGKTGLGVGLIEDAAIDKIPVIAIDPKGDLANLMLTFPDLRPEDFRPWIGVEEAATSGKSADALAESKAELWRKGLAAWGQDGERIRRLRETADFAVYTPGSTAGLPISVLRGFDAPPAAVRGDAELYAERVSATATSLLALLQVDADPLTSREHILLSNLLTHAWDAGRNLDLAALIAGVQQPPFEKVGVLSVDAVFPPKDRLGFAMRINNLLASPAFQAWTVGEPLAADRLLYTETGKPRVSVLSIAHLTDAERMFFVSMLLADLIGWMRSQPGTGSLRAILYIDELFGYMPPVANPATKPLLLTLLKQARAIGVGLVLATQNPVDLDYKGLSNAGTWFVGRLQTERDKLRLVEGLLGAAGGSLDKATIERTLSSLGKRVFLLHNVHESAPVVFETRWVLSYLAGPMTREQIRTLMAGRSTPAATAPAAASPVSPTGAKLLAHAPAAPAGVPQYFLPVRKAIDPAAVVYLPRALGLGDVTYDNARHDIHEQHRFLRIAPITDDAVPLDWEHGEPAGLDADELEQEPLPGARFQDLPSAASDAKNYGAWSKLLQSYLRADRPLTLLRSTSLKLVSKPDETERDFRIRLQGAAREKRDAEVEKLRQKYGSKVATLDDRIRRAEQAVEREQEQAKQRGLDTAVSVGSALLGAFLGRKRMSRTSATRIGSAVRSVGRATREAGDIGRAKENVDALLRSRADLEAELEREIQTIDSAYDAQAESLEELSIRPKSTGIQLHAVGLAWAPHGRDDIGILEPLWK